MSVHTKVTNLLAVYSVELYHPLQPLALSASTPKLVSNIYSTLKNNGLYQLKVDVGMLNTVKNEQADVSSVLLCPFSAVSGFRYPLCINFSFAPFSAVSGIRYPLWSGTCSGSSRKQHQKQRIPFSMLSLIHKIISFCL